MSNDGVREIEEKIADLKARWPAHSVLPSMWQQLEELEAELEAAKRLEIGERAKQKDERA